MCPNISWYRYIVLSPGPLQLLCILYYIIYVFRMDVDSSTKISQFTRWLVILLVYFVYSSLCIARDLHSEYALDHFSVKYSLPSLETEYHTWWDSLKDPTELQVCCWCYLWSHRWSLINSDTPEELFQWRMETRTGLLKKNVFGQAVNNERVNPRALVRAAPCVQRYRC